jgi:hypothetical protein
MEEPIAGVSALGWDKIRRHAPVRANNEISCKAKCLEARPSETQPGCGVIRLQNDLFNQRGELVYSAECAFLVLCRPGKENQSGKLKLKSQNIRRYKRNACPHRKFYREGEFNIPMKGESAHSDVSCRCYS